MSTLFLAFGIGSTELLIILAIAVVLFGAGKLADVGKHLGAGIRNFKSEVGADDPAKLPPPDPGSVSVPRDVTEEQRVR